MPQPPVSRRDLRRALALNALIHPVPGLVAAGVLVAAVLLGAAWLALVAVACWLVLAAMTFFDEREAEKVGERARARRRSASARADPAQFSLEIGARIKAANAARDAIAAAIASSRSPSSGVTAEVDALLAAMHADAVRAQRIHEFLAGESLPAVERRAEREPRAPVRGALEAKLAALTRLRRRLDDLLAGLDHVVATLQTVQAEILAADELEHAAAEDRALASRVSELRVQVEAMAAGVDEAYAETRAHASRRV
jgi:hypothetical protein